MYIIFCIIFGPIVALAAIKMALDMNRPSRSGRRSGRGRRRKW